MISDLLYTPHTLPEQMASVEEKAKDYEATSARMDPWFTTATTAIDIIKKFIADRKLIIYGGTAVDYALRLRGDNIYPDEALALPDLDFYSPNSVSDAYDLARILYTAGFTSARAINALYVITMRVDIGDNHFLADVSYVPPSIFETLPTIIYEGMRCIDPIFQKIDFHSCLAFPFDNPPREVIFEKWAKYVTRFNKMHHHYPTPPHKHVECFPIVTHDILPDVLLGGLGAYAAYYTRYITDNPAVPAMIKATFKHVDGQVTYNADRIIMLSDDLAKCEAALDSPEYYRAYINIMPKHLRGIMNGVTTEIYSSENKLVCYTEPVPGVKCVSVQWMLLQFLTLAHTTNDANLKSTYYAYYESSMLMIKSDELRLASLQPEKAQAEINRSPFQLNINMYGSDNISPAYEIAINRVKADQSKPYDQTPTPRGYYPARGNSPSTFDYNNPWFMKDGQRDTNKK